MSERISISSLVDGVEVAAINTTEGNKILMNLLFKGNGSSPSLTVTGSAINLGPEDISSFLSKFMQGPSLTAGGANISQTSQLASFTLKALSGSNVIHAGWESPTTLTLTLQGNTTLNEANHISLDLFPFTG